MMCYIYWKYITVACTHGDVRLEDGSNQYEGRVEVCFNGRWGTVCDNNWGIQDVQTVCGQLGYGTGMHKMF